MEILYSFVSSASLEIVENFSSENQKFLETRKRFNWAFEEL